MAVHLTASQSGTYDLSAGDIVLDTTLSTDAPIIAIVVLQIGSDEHPLCGVGGTFRASVSVSGAEAQPGTTLVLDTSTKAQDTDYSHHHPSRRNCGGVLSLSQ